MLKAWDGTHSGASFEIALPDGQVVCLVNVSAKNDGTWANVDVILTEGKDAQHKLTAIAWKPEGAGQAFREVSPTGLVAVDISKKEVE